MTETPQLTLDVLAHYVPIIHAGYDSHDPMVIRRAQRATEELLEISMPLIKNIARKEYNRRQKWNSRVPLEDIIQEGTWGFLRGIRAYNVDGNHKSPTNYLGQWVHSDIRRNIEEMDHDFSIPHETIERHRKIRAIRSSLFTTLGREPSDEEIIAHHNDEKIVNKLGPTKKSATSKRKPLEQKHIDEERAYASVTGALPPVEPNVSPSVENTITLPLNSFFTDVFHAMNIGEVQEKVIRAKFGLPPYDSEQPLRTISNETGLSNYKITQIINAFLAEMGSSNSTFHRILKDLPLDEIEALGLGWVLSSFHSRTSHGTPKVLTTLTGKTSFGEPGRDVARYTPAYRCPTHGVFTVKLLMKRNLTITSPCPTCGAPSPKTSDPDS